MNDCIKTNEQIVMETFHLFDIEISDCKAVSVAGVDRVVFSIAPGIRIEQILGLRRELQMALGTETLTLITPVPGTHYCAVDFPNKGYKRIAFKSLIDSKGWCDNATFENMWICIGVEMNNRMVTLELKEGLSMLIRGGVSADEEAVMFIKSMLMSANYAATSLLFPKVIILDPTLVDLEVMHHLPYVEKPVTQSIMDGVEVLRETVKEMRSRYSRINEEGCRSINSYNEAARMKGSIQLQYVLIVINGLEDFFILDGIYQEFEQLLIELLSRGQRVGINIIMRIGPGCEGYIPNTIYANCKYMAHFQTINEDGSEANNGKLKPNDLMGNGDMLFIENGWAGIRVQTPFLTNEEIKQAAEDWA